MSQFENGIASLVNRPASITIASSTNANPIEVTTTAPHLLTTGDTVYISAHLVNLSANGVWIATVTGASKFTIASAGVGVGGATGAVQSLGFDSVFQIPTDGVDDENAASVNVPFEALADRTAWLSARTGPLFQFASRTSGADDDSYGTWSSNTFGSASWANIASSPSLSFYGLLATDVAEVTFQSTGTTGGGADPCRLAIGLVVSGGSVAKVGTTGRRINGTNTDSGLTVRFSLAGLGVTAAKVVGFSVMGLGGVGSPPTLALSGDWEFTVKIWRGV